MRRQAPPAGRGNKRAGRSPAVCELEGDEQPPLEGGSEKKGLEPDVRWLEGMQVGVEGADQNVSLVPSWNWRASVGLPPLLEREKRRRPDTIMKPQGPVGEAWAWPLFETRERRGLRPLRKREMGVELDSFLER